MAVAPDNDFSIGPFFSKATNDLFQQRGNVALLTPSARFQDRSDQFARQAFIYV